jgi:hypothetical protein
MGTVLVGERHDGASLPERGNCTTQFQLRGGPGPEFLLFTPPVILSKPGLSRCCQRISDYPPAADRPQVQEFLFFGLLSF